MLKILDKDKAPLKGLRVYKDYCIESVLELDDRTLSFSAPLRNIRGYVQLEGYIETRDDIYVVKEIRKGTDGYAQVVAQLDMEALEGKAFRQFRSTEQIIRSALQLAFAGTGWTVGECSISKKRTLAMSNVSAMAVLKQALKTYRCEIRVHSKSQTIDIYERIGEDKGVYFSSQLNLRSLDVQGTSYDFYTELEPYGKDGLTIESVNGGKTYISNHQYSNKSKRCIWKDERYTVAESLLEDATAKLADMSKPYTSYNADVADLASSSGGKYTVLAYGLGDTVTLMDGITETRELQRIMAMKRYPDEPHRNTCTLANRVLTFDELAQKYEAAADTVDNITNDNGQIDGDAIDGIYSRQVVDLEDAIIQSATILDLTTKYLQVTGKITAVEGEFGQLTANVAEFEQATIDRLTAIDATIYDLKVTDLSAANAKIQVLEAASAAIKSLLAGNAGVGDLQNIHLTSANAVIDSALIRSAVMQSVTIGDLLAGDISTNRFRIVSDDGGILIQGATQQWRDSNGVIRMQAGRDAQGNFTFSLFDASGTGVLIDSTGIKPGAIADGLIVNDMVADNAAIAGNKLDIASVIRSINGSTEVINSNRIWFDGQNQSLNQVYSQMSSAITNVQTTAINASSTANAASGTANAAADAAQKALETLSGISTLDALGASLDNDAHVVHTNTDGSGGDYGPCCSKITVYLGDTDVSDHATYTITKSAGVTGRWDAQSRTYFVTGMTTDNGYVDIEALYGTQDNYLTTRSGKRLTTRSGKYLLVRSGGSRIRKRFSISKAPDGKIGLSYSLRCSATAIRKQQDGALVPASVTLTATKNDNGLISSYAGRYKAEESTDGTTYAVKYQSAVAEAIKIYTPSGGGVKSIRCTLYDSGGVMELDVQTIIVLADAEGLAEEIQGVQDVVQTTNTRVANIETGLDGIRANISDMTTDLHGLTDNTLLYNVRYNDNGNGTTTLNAVVYKDGKDVTDSYPERWYTWRRKTEAGETYLGYGRSITVSNAAYEFGGVTIGRFTTYETRYLTTRSGKRLTTRSGKPLTIWKEN